MTPLQNTSPRLRWVIAAIASRASAVYFGSAIWLRISIECKAADTPRNRSNAEVTLDTTKLCDSLIGPPVIAVKISKDAEPVAAA